jgi:hypothetical protein
MALHEPGDGGVIGLGLRSDHPIGHVLDAGPLDRLRRPDPARVRVQNQRHHHRRIKRRPTAPVHSIGDVERLELHRRHSIKHKPREVILRQPPAHVRRHQKRLLAITRDKPLRHARHRLKPPGRHPDLRDSPSRRSTIRHGRRLSLLVQLDSELASATRA